MSTTIILADDHNVVRHGLRTLLETEGDFTVIGEASDGLEAVRLTEELKPDVLICDVMMRGINGLEVARQVNKRISQVSVVILSMYANEGYVLEALKAGAKAYVLKESSSDELVRAVREAALGHRYLSPPLTEWAVEAYIQKTESSSLDPYDRLTTREREILHLVAQGYTSAEISSILYISRRTAETHRANLMRKLGLNTKRELLVYALQRGIIPGGKTA